MVALNTPNQQNGSMVHYFEDNEHPCHPAIIAGNARSVDGYGTEIDIIQLDNEENGVIVPLKRTNIPYDETFNEAGELVPADNTCHNTGCMRAPTVIVME